MSTNKILLRKLNQFNKTFQIFHPQITFYRQTDYFNIGDNSAYIYGSKSIFKPVDSGSVRLKWWHVTSRVACSQFYTRTSSLSGVYDMVFTLGYALLFQSNSMHQAIFDIYRGKSLDVS